jgi:hypothetical protein
MLQCREANGYLGACGQIGKALLFSEGASAPSVLGAIPYTTFRGACGRAVALCGPLVAAQLDHSGKLEKRTRRVRKAERPSRVAAR